MDDTEKLLTKADILEGKEKREKVFIKRLGGYLEINPLTEAEWSRVQAVNTRGISMSGEVEAKEGTKPKNFDMTIDLEKSAEATSEAERLIVSFGVANIKLTPEDVGRLRPAGVVKEVSNHILRLTGVSLRRPDRGIKVDKVEVVSSFRDK